MPQYLKLFKSSERTKIIYVFTRSKSEKPLVHVIPPESIGNRLHKLVGLNKKDSVRESTGKGRSKRGNE